MGPDRTNLATQTCALTENRTSDPLLSGMTLNQLSHTDQGLSVFHSVCWNLVDLHVKTDCLGKCCGFQASAGQSHVLGVLVLHSIFTLSHPICGHFNPSFPLSSRTSQVFPPYLRWAITFSTLLGALVQCVHTTLGGLAACKTQYPGRAYAC